MKFLRPPLATSVLVTAMISNSLAYDPNDIENYSRFSLSAVLIEADSVIVGVPTYFRFGEDVNLMRLDNVQPIYDDAKPIEKSPGRLVIVDPKTPGARSPVIPHDRKVILFLKTKIVDDAFRVQFELDKSDRVFELCKPWQASLCLDFSIESLTKDIARQRYGIRDPDALVDVVQKLSRWRSARNTREESVRELLALLKATQGQAIYEENIPPILAHLGTKVVKQGDEFIIEKPAKQQNTAPAEEGAGSQPGK